MCIPASVECSHGDFLGIVLLWVSNHHHCADNLLFVSISSSTSLLHLHQHNKKIYITNSSNKINKWNCLVYRLIIKAYIRPQTSWAYYRALELRHKKLAQDELENVVRLPWWSLTYSLTHSLTHSLGVYDMIKIKVVNSEET